MKIAANFAQSSARPPMERMVQIHHALQRGAATNCTKLADAFGVSVRTIMRDIAFMRERLDLPIEFDAPGNAFRYTAPVTQFPALQVSEGELFTLLVARKALEVYRGTPFHAQLAASFEKISAGLKETVSFTPSDELQSVSFKNIGLGRLDPAVFNALSRAVLRRLEVAFDYRKPGAGAAERRRVQPCHLAYRENLCYLIGFDVERGALRTFALPRISRLSLRKTTFTPPAGFSPEKFFANALGVVGGERTYRVVIHFSARAADRIREREWHESQELHELPAGAVELVLHLGALEEIQRWVLTWGADAEAIEPPELRENLKQTIAALARRYR